MLLICKKNESAVSGGRGQLGATTRERRSRNTLVCDDVTEIAD
jgi:hypothetical protein